jgi:predicted transcriptional regulator
MSCFRAIKDLGPDPIIDVDEILKKYCWRELVSLKFYERPSKFDMEVRWNCIDKTHKLIKFKINKAEVGGLEAKIQKRDLCLFRTQFKNHSKEEQSYTFKTERQTKSSVNVSVQKGFQVGGNLAVEFSLPGQQLVPGMDTVKMTGGLSGQLQLTKTKGESFEETLTWTVDSQVKVPPHSATTASLIIQEENLSAEFSVESTFRVVASAVSVYLKEKKTGRIVQKLEIPRESFAGVFENMKAFKSEEAGTVKCVTMGVCHVVFGAEQVVQVNSVPLKLEEPLPAVFSHMDDGRMNLAQVASAGNSDNKQ